MCVCTQGGIYNTDVQTEYTVQYDDDGMQIEIALDEVEMQL